MSSGLYRVLTALLNLGLIAAIVVVGLGIFRASEPPPGERVPHVNPPALAIEASQKQSNELQTFAIVWQQLDVPKPVVVQQPTNTTPVAPPRPQDLSTRYKVRMVLFNPDEPSNSQCVIANSMSGGKGRIVTKGDNLDGYAILSIEVDGADAVVTLDDNGVQRKIRLQGPSQ
ncbi:MAG: hypothetical protein KDD82_08695 [Planctomycetes bacterium]|nr:hypothetical protein [Planctomycetota bacterium]